MSWWIGIIQEKGEREKQREEEGVALQGGTNSVWKRKGMKGEFLEKKEVGGKTERALYAIERELDFTL